MKLTMKISNFKEIIFLASLAVIFFSISVILLGSPGLGEEEAFAVHPAVSMLVKGFPLCYLWTDFYGYNIFLMLNAWVGPVSSLLFVPTLYAFGISVFTIRLTRLAYGFITILLLYFFAKDFFDRKTAGISAFLLATFPFYIFMYRQGYLDDGILPTFLLAALLCFYKFYKNPKNKFLYWGALFTGLGLCSKISFLWFIVAIMLCLLLLRIRVKLNKKNVSISLFLFNLAILPMTVFNIQNIRFINTTEGSTIGAVINNLVVTYGGVNNLHVFDNICLRIKLLKAIFINYLFGEKIIANDFYFYFFILALFFYLAKFTYSRKINNQVKMKFIVLLLLVMFFLSCFTLNYLKIEHAMIYLPLCVLIIAKFLNEVFKNRWVKLKYLIILFITCMNLLSLRDCYRILYRKGLYYLQYNWIYTSTSVYALSQYLMEKDIKSPISIGPLLACNLEILTLGKVLHGTVCLDNNENYDNSKSYLEKSIHDNGKYYLVVAHNNLKEFILPLEEMLIKYSKTADIEKVFNTKDGFPEILLFKIKDGKYNFELTKNLL